MVSARALAQGDIAAHDGFLCRSVSGRGTTGNYLYLSVV